METDGIKAMDKFNRSISLLCWAYNEEELIGEYLERAAKMMDEVASDYEIVLVDDCSTDRTNEIATEFQKIHPQLKIFRNEKNLNVGLSSQKAIQMASKEFLFWQTIDWSYDLSNLRSHLEFLKKYDIVQGVRRHPVEARVKFLKPFLAAAKIFNIRYLSKRSDTVSKALVSVINFTLIRLFFRVPLSDFQNITFYPTKWIQSIKYESSSAFSNPEGLIKSYWAGKTMKEVSIGFIPRQKGEAKGTKFKALKMAVKDLFGLWFKWIVLGERGKIKKGAIERLAPSEM
jgi:glycosyltransferase involved in cell wall biosynthesis